MKKIAIILPLALLLIIPVSAFAVNLPPPEYPANAINEVWPLIVKILEFIWPIFVGVAILMLIVAGFIFLTANGDPGKVKLARDSVIYGIVGIIVALLSFSMVGIVEKLVTPAPVGGGNGGGAPTGACIGQDGCINGLTAQDCANISGTYQGDGEICPDEPAGPSDGACCFPGFIVPGGSGNTAPPTCQYKTADLCTASTFMGNHGTYQGDGSSCGPPSPCL